MEALLVNNELKTSSRIVSEVFGKAHRSVLRNIRNLDSRYSEGLSSLEDGLFLTTRRSHKPLRIVYFSDLVISNARSTAAFNLPTK